MAHTNSGLPGRRRVIDGVQPFDGGLGIGTL
jgi:hypothetical protein